MRIEATFLGTPEIYVDGKALTFPFLKAKIAALLLLEQGEISRERLALLLWGERDNEGALKNLRNALSCLRSVLPVFTADRRLIALNNGLSLVSDLQRLNQPQLWRPDEVETLSRPYLDLLDLDGWHGFSSWLSERRALYQNSLIRGIKSRAVGVEAPLWYERVLELDPYDEEAYAALTELYQKSGRFMATARLARDYSLLLEGKEAESAVDSVPPTVERELCALCVRLQEQIQLTDSVENEEVFCSFLWGEEGIGKTHLIACVRQELALKGWLCFETAAIEGEERYPFNPLALLVAELARLYPLEKSSLPFFKQDYLVSCFPVLEAAFHENSAPFRGAIGLSELNPPLIAQFLSEYLSEYAGGRPCLLVLDDAHWLDQTSAEVLCAMLHQKRTPLHLLFSSYQEARAPLIARLRAHSFSFCELTLSRLGKEQIAQICQELHPDRKWGQEELDAIERYSEGNPFYICEMLRCIDSKALEIPSTPPEHLFTHRLMALNNDQRALLEGVAVFSAEVAVEDLETLLDICPTRFSLIFESLQYQGILKERRSDEGEILYSFTHSRIKGLVLEGMTHTQQRALHLRRVLLLQQAIGGEAHNKRSLFRQLAYHCEMVGERNGELTARIQELKAHFSITHTLFPLVTDQELRHFVPSVDETDYTYQRLLEAESLLDRQVRREGRSPSLRACERDLLTLRGGYLCWRGEYVDAEHNLKEALRKELQEGTVTGQLNVCEQLCYIGIQTDNPETLYRASVQMYRLALTEHSHPQAGMAARFLALYHILKANSRSAMRLLQQSIRFFEILEELGASYTLSIVAATHYQGDVHMVQGRYLEALHCYLRCIQIVESNGFYRGLGLSLAKGSYCYIRLGEYEKAEPFLKRCDDYFQMSGSSWSGSVQGGGIAYSLYALVAARREDWRETANRLKIAEDLCLQLNKPLWRAILSWVKGQILTTTGDVPAFLLVNYLSDGASSYLQQSEMLFKSLGWKSET